MQTRVLIVFGAAVRPDGSASGTLRRRTLGALALSRVAPRPLDDRAADSKLPPADHLPLPARKFLVTGGQGRFGPPEAIVMRDLLLAAGVRDDQIEIEPESRDTLESALRCAAILSRDLVGADGADSIEVVVATSRYHAPRCWLLLRLLGVRAGIGKIPTDRKVLGLRSWLYSCVREALAIPWDAFLVLTLHRAARIDWPEAPR